MNKYDKALEYEILVKKEYAFADDAIKQAKVIFDIGGHIGLFSQYCLSLNPGCIIHYFEPIPQLYKQAKEKFKNQNIYLNNYGISSETGEKTMYFNSEKTMQSSLCNGTFLNPKGLPIKVQMKNLQEYCTQKNIENISILKLDVEGMEYEILEGLSDSFLQKIQAILLEFHCFDDLMVKRLTNLEKTLSIYYKLQKINNPYDSRLGYLFLIQI